MNSSQEQESYYRRFSQAEYERRYAKVREAMKENNLDCLLFYGCAGLGNSVNVRYLSNYSDYLQSYLALSSHSGY